MWFENILTIFTDGNCISGTNSTVQILLSLVDRFLNNSRNAQNSSSSSQNLSKQLASIEAIPIRFCTTPRSIPNEIAVSDTGFRCQSSFSTIVMKNFLIKRSWSGWIIFKKASLSLSLDSRNLAQLLRGITLRTCPDINLLARDSFIPITLAVCTTFRLSSLYWNIK